MAGGTVETGNTAGGTAPQQLASSGPPPGKHRRPAPATVPGAGDPGAAAGGGGTRPVRRVRAGRGLLGTTAGRGLAWGAGAALAALLFAGYLRVSWTVAATSDGAAQALQARDMLAGNWLLHGWTLSDVSFYTTELPEYVLVELIRPLGAGVIHVAAAVSYTLLVLLAFALGRGRGRGRAGLLGGALAASIMLAPQLGYGAFVLLLSPDHTGTQVPLLLGWLLLDRAPRRWWVPAGLCLLLALVQFADRAALLTAVLPLFLVAAVSALRLAAVNSRRGGWRTCWFEGALCVAAVASAGVAWAGARLLSAAGGFTAHPLPFTLAPLRLLWTHTWLTGWGVLELYGANFLGVTGPAGLTFAAVHLAGLGLAVAASWVALRRFLRSRRPAQADGGLVDSVLAVAIIANLVSYLLSIEPGTVLGTGYDAREIAAVLPLGAVLAGRVLGPELAGRIRGPEPAGSGQPGLTFGARQPALAFGARPAAPVGGSEPGRLPRMRVRVRDQAAGPRVRSGSAVLMLALALGMAGYAGALGYSAARPEAAGPDAVLADWLAAHGLRYGLGGASANIVTLDSAGRTGVAGVTVAKGRVRPLLYQSSLAAYDPRLHDATFLVTRAPAARAGDAAENISAAAVRATFGVPSRVYRFHGFTVDVWGVNLLTKLHSEPFSG